MEKRARNPFYDTAEECGKANRASGGDRGSSEYPAPYEGRSRKLAGNFVNKKDYERCKRESAEREAKASIESKNRQGRIKVLWTLDFQQLRTAKKPIEIGDVRKVLKRQKFAKLLTSLKELFGEDDPYDDINELVELVILQDQEIEYLTLFHSELERLKTHYPEEFQSLSSSAFLAHIQPILKEIRAREKPKQTYERKRRYYKSGDRGEIENGFGNLRQILSQPFNPGLAAYQQALGIYTSPVLDDIFAENGVSMLRLQQLFGLNRNRFPKKLPRFKNGRERLYDYRAVTKIMAALLSEKTPSFGATKRGRPGEHWLNDSAVRARILAGMEAHIKTGAAPKHVADSFLRVIRRHLPDSAKK